VGDSVIALASSGLHSNGYSLARYVLLGDGKLGLHAQITELGRTVGEELLEPTRIYAQDCLALMKAADVHAFSHVTGGGIAANLARVLPENSAVDIYRQTWTPPPIFDLIQREGSVPLADAERTLNMGIGMLAIVAENQVDQALRELAQRDLEAWVCGTVRERTQGEKGDSPAKGGGGGAVSLLGDH
jgi:phosphoribosylformylglycinamidine cyclo-ligase